MQNCDDRFGKRIEQNGTWTVFAISTGLPAEVGSRQTTGMQMSDAIEMVELLNTRQ